MTRLPMDYSRCIIYKIVCLNPSVDEIYVGHTIDFIKRKCRHKSNCNNENQTEYNIKLYQYIRENGGWDNFNIIPIEEYSCENSIQARIREEYWRQELTAQLNSHRAYINEENRKIRDTELYKLWREKNKEYCIEVSKKYREKHKEELLEKRKLYRNKQNKDIVKKYMVEWYQQNKERIAEQRKEKYTCECGSTFRINNKSQHEKSIKHQNFINSKA